MNDFHAINCMTLFEYEIRLKAYELKQVDKDYDIHLQAWSNWNVQAMKESGKKRVPVFKTFKQFFDYEKRIKDVLGKQSEPQGIEGIVRIMKQQEERGVKNGKL